MKSAKNDFCKIIGLGNLDYEININLTESEARQFKFDIDKVNSIQDLNSFFQNDYARDKIQVQSSNKLINLLLFINKTNQNKSYTEFLSLNSISASKETGFLKEHIKNQYSDNFLFLTESSLLPSSKLTVNINVQNKPSKVLYEEPEKKENKEVLEAKDEAVTNPIEENKNESTENKEEAKKSIIPEKPEESKLEQGNTGNKINSLSGLKYDFKSCDYVFVDVKNFITDSQISVSDIYDFLFTRIINQYLKTSIVLIFPNLEDNFPLNLLSPLIDLITISDIVLYEKKDAIKICSLLGYKAEEKNFEVRFMFLKELKRGNYKAQRTSIFLDDFSKMTAIVQETQSNSIIYHEELNFEIGFKVDLLKIVSNNFSMLKFAFFGGLFSRLVLKKNFPLAFAVGVETVKTLIELLQNQLPIPDDNQYFLVNDAKLLSKNQNKQSKNSNLPKKTFTNEGENSKKIEYLGSSSSEYEESIKKSNLIEVDKKRLLKILEANQVLQTKLNNLIMKSPSQYSDDEFLKKSGGRKLPGLKGANGNPFNKISNIPYRSSYEKKKKLKPLSKAAYDRLTGANKLNYESVSFNKIQPLIEEKNVLINSQSNDIQANQNSNSESEVKENKEINNEQKDVVEGEKKEEKVENQQTTNIQDKKSPTKATKFDISKVDPSMMKKFLVMTQSYNQIVNKENQTEEQKLQQSQISTNPAKPVKKHQIIRTRQDLEPVTHIPDVVQQHSDGYKSNQDEEKNKKNFKGPEYFDQKHNRNKFRFIEETKKDVQVEEIFVEKKGKKEDYDDFQRTSAKADRIKQRIEEEKRNKEREEKEKKNKEKERRKKEKEDKEKAEKERIEQELKEQEDKKEEKKDEKKDKKDEKKEDKK